MDASRFIDDWTNGGCHLSDGGVLDSTDAPAGLFLLTLLAAQRGFPRGAGGAPELPGFSAGITAALGAIEATQDSDGLTWAKPGYPVKYLMDQSETYAGLVAAWELGRVLGSAGIVERGFRSGRRLLEATLETVRACPCSHGCPSCVQSPKCGNGNEPLDKAGAVLVLDIVLNALAKAA